MDLATYDVGFQLTFFSVFAIILLYQLLLQRILNPNEAGACHDSRRFLSVYENAFNLLPKERDGACIVHLVVALTSKRKLVKEHVKEALVLLAKRQPMLRALIRNSQSQNYFEIMNDDKILEWLDITTSQVSACDWNEVCGDVTSEPFTLLWRAVLLKEQYAMETKRYSNTLVFTFNHAALDGVSSIKFAKQFYESLNMIVEHSGTLKKSFTTDENFKVITAGLNESRYVDDKIDRFSLQSDATELLKNERRFAWKLLWDFPGISSITRLLYKKMVRDILARKPGYAMFKKLLPNSSYSGRPATKLTWKFYTKDETRKIINACKVNNCTVTGALMTTAHLALCQMVKDDVDTPEGDIKLKHGFAVNTKPYCRPKPHEDYLGHFALVCKMSLDYLNYANNEDDFWKFARESTKIIHGSLKDEEYIAEHIKQCESFSAEELLNEIKSPRERAEVDQISFSNGISSAGSFKFGEGLTDPIYELDHCLYWNTVHGISRRLVHFNVTVNGKMSWVIACDPSTISDVHVEQISNWCFEHLLSFSQFSEINNKKCI